MDLRTFLALLLVYRSNFHLLHWNAKGKGFDRMHATAAEYYERLLDDADSVAEMTMRLEEHPVNYKEAFEVLDEISDKEFVILESEKLYDREEFSSFTDKMFQDILTSIEELLESDVIKEPSNVGIKADLESMHGYYDLQMRYLNKRRMDDED